MNQLKKLIISNIHNINDIEVFIRTPNTHIVVLNNKFANYNHNDIINTVKNLNVLNTHVIIQYKYCKRQKQQRLKNNNKTKVCSCNSTCRCDDYDFEEIDVMKEFNDYYVVEINKLHEYIIDSDNRKIYGFSFNLDI